MTPKDWDEIKGLLERIIGQPDHTGGSTTEGTVMGKENKILEEIYAIKDKRETLSSLYKTVTFPAGSTNTYVIEPGYKFKFLGLNDRRKDSSETEGSKTTLSMKLQYGDTYSKTYDIPRDNNYHYKLLTFSGDIKAKHISQTDAPEPFLLNSWFDKIELICENTASGNFTEGITIYILTEVD